MTLLLTYGEGRIEHQVGTIDGERCLCFKDTATERAVGAVDAKAAPSQVPQEYYDVILSFKTLESARVLQDVVNEFVCKWSRETAPVADPPIHTSNG